MNFIPSEYSIKLNSRKLESFMVRKKGNYLLLFGLMLLISMSVFAQKQSASETVQSFYKFHLSRSGLFSLHEVKLRQRWFTSELNRLLLFELKREDEFTRKHPDEKPHFGDGFPFEPLEECVVGEKIIRNLYQTKEISVDSKRAVVEIKFFMPKECQSEKEDSLIDTLKIELLKTKNSWLINNWIYSDESKLSDDLKREKY